MSKDNIDAVHEIDPVELLVDEIAKDIAWQQLKCSQRQQFRERARWLLARVDAVKDLTAKLGESLIKFYQ